jgi:hypothetical protein
MSLRPEKVYISDEIQYILVTNKAYHAQLFVLGMNKVGVFTEISAPLRRDGGCEMMPGVYAKTIVAAYLEMVKKKGITPAAFGYRTTHGEGLTSDIFRFPGALFICSTDHGFTVAMPYSQGGRNDVRRNYEVAVVDKNFDPVLGRIVTPKKPRAKARATSSNK